MREALNSNPIAQIAVIGVLLVGVGFFVLSSSGGGEDEGGGSAETLTVSTGDTSVELTPAPGAGSAAPPSLDAALAQVNAAATETPPLPRPVVAAWRDNRTLVLLFVHDGGIDDRLARQAIEGVAGLPGVALFVVPAAKIARYAAIAEGVGVDRVPALVVVTPKDRDKLVPVASVHFGYQSRESVRQAVIDAGYRGPTVDYHP